MRIVLLSSTLIALTCAAGVALAQPAGLTKAHGGMAAGDKVLYTFENDTPGKSACNGPCNNFWPPFAPSADAKPDADWTIITREDGAKQWAYKGKPVYFFSRDMTGRPPMGESVQNWKMLR